MDAMDVLNGCTRAAYAPGDLTRLKRMPHVFPRVLELPLHAETPVSVVEYRDCYRFQVRLPGAHVDDVKVEVLEIVPGATKVLVRGVDRFSADDVPEVNFWRFRLPPTTVPEKSVASYEHELLSVTIPKLLVSCNNESLDSEDDGDSDMDARHALGETEEERVQREVLEDLESFGSPRRIRSSPRSSSSSPSPRKSFESEVDLEKLQHEVLEDLESFGSPRRRSARCTQSLTFQSTGSQDFFRGVGSWVGGFTVPVQ